MRRLSGRVDKLDGGSGPPPLIVHVEPGQTRADAIAAYERAHGPIPPGVPVVFIIHSFKSVI